MSAATAEFFHDDVFTGHGLDHFRAGDEHLRGLVLTTKSVRAGE